MEFPVIFKIIQSLAGSCMIVFMFAEHIKLQVSFENIIYIILGILIVFIALLKYLPGIDPEKLGE